MNNLIVYTVRPSKPCSHENAHVEECDNGIDLMMCDECGAEWEYDCTLPHEFQGRTVYTTIGGKHGA